MTGLRASTLVCALVAVQALPSSSAEGQVSVPEAWSVELGGRVQSQLVHSSAVGAPGVDFLVRRARLTVDLTRGRWLSGRLQPELAGGVGLKDAWVGISPTEGVRISAGQFKRAFDVFELSSSTELSVIERDGRVPGVDRCSGPGGTCSLSRLSEKLDYAGRDVGLRIEGSAGSRLEYRATVTNGPGESRRDSNGAKSTAGRLSVEVTPGVRLSGNGSVRDYVAERGGTSYGAAWGADVEVGAFRSEGVHLQAGLLAGDNWHVLRADGEPAAFAAAQAILTWYGPLDGEGPLGAVEPLARVSWADPDTGVADDAALLFTPGLTAYLGGRNKVGVNVDVYAPEVGDVEWSLKLQTFLHF